MEVEPRPTGFFSAMGTPISQVEPFLYIGNRRGALNKALLKQHNIRRVVQIQDSVTTPFFPGMFAYLTYAVVDVSCCDIAPLLPQALPFIAQGIASGEAVFVHCDAGMSRSGSVIVAYLMASRSLSYVEALREARKARACIAPNPGFAEQLRNTAAEDLKEYLRS
jgi:protein-tyrosine phosphatase